MKGLQGTASPTIRSAGSTKNEVEPFTGRVEPVLFFMPWERGLGTEVGASSHPPDP
jgi:hypothetical protein